MNFQKFRDIIFFPCQTSPTTTFRPISADKAYFTVFVLVKPIIPTVHNYYWYREYYCSGANSSRLVTNTIMAKHNYREGIIGVFGWNFVWLIGVDREVKIHESSILVEKIEILLRSSYQRTANRSCFRFDLTAKYIHIIMVR